MSERQSQQQEPRERGEKPVTSFLPLGIAFGAGIGTALGAAYGNVGIGVAMGAGVGVAIGISLDMTRRERG